MKALWQIFQANRWLMLFVALAAILRLFHLDYQSLWDDEIATMMQADPSLDFTSAWNIYLQYDNMPPIYFIVLRYLMMLFGYKSIVLRAFSAVFGIVCIPAIYSLTKKLYDTSIANWAAFITAINPMLIYYSQEGRPYTLFVFFTLLSFTKFLDGINNPKNITLVLYTLYTTLLIYAHFFGVFILFAQAIYFIFRISIDKTNRFELIKYFWPVPILITLLHYPSFPQFFKNSDARETWIKLPGLTPFNDTLHAFMGQAEVPIAITLILLLVFLLNTFNGNLKNTSFYFLIFWMVGFLVIPLFRTYTTMPMIVHRYLIPVLPVVIIMISAALSTIKEKSTRMLTLWVFTLFSLGDLIIVTDYYFKISKADYRGNAELIHVNRKTKEPVIAEIGWHYSYYIKDVTYMTLGNYINTLRNKSLPDGFWYCGVRENELKLSDKERDFIFQNYYTDFWKNSNSTQAIHFKKLPQKGAFIGPHQLLNADFSSGMCVVNAAATVTVDLESGNYNLHFTTLSLPEAPLNDTNSKALISINGMKAGEFISNHLYSGYNDIKWAFAGGTNTISIQNTTHGNGKRFLIFKNLVIEKIP